MRIQFAAWRKGPWLPPLQRKQILHPAPLCILYRKGGFYGVFQNGIDVSRYQGNINWGRVAAAGKQFAIVRVGSANSGGSTWTRTFAERQRGQGRGSAGRGLLLYLRPHPRRRCQRADDVPERHGRPAIEYPVFVDVEDSSLTSLGRAALTSLVQYAMDILYQRKWYAGWYSYTNYINSYLNAAALSRYPLWVADYRSALGYNGSYAMWQYTGSGRASGISGACDLDRSYKDFLPEIKAGGLQQLWGLRPFYGDGQRQASGRVQRPVRVF